MRRPPCFTQVLRAASAGRGQRAAKAPRVGGFCTGTNLALNANMKLARADEPISTYMTPQPHSIGQEQTLSAAAAQMRELGVRHLPVLHGGKLTGLLSDRDIRLVEALPGVDPAVVRVEEAMSLEPYHAAPATSVAVVAAEMARRKYGAAVIMDGNRLVGMFTTVDAMKILAENLPKSA